MKGDVGLGVVIVLVMAAAAATIGLGGMFTEQSENLDVIANNTADNTSTKVSNASCQRECLTDNPSKGSGYYRCLNNNGCS